MGENSIPLFIPDVPDEQALTDMLKEVWESKIFTNSGPKVQQLEDALQKYLDVPFVSLYANATLALTASLQVMELKGEVITSPFTFIATTNAIIQAGLTPVFVDIDPVSMNLDPNLVKKAINTNTAAILPVHAYGNPCQVKYIERIGKKFNIPIIFDAAQAFGVRIYNKSILNFGDLSVVSLHATKVLSSIEGGFVVSKSHELKNRLDQYRNFGISDPGCISGIGTNAKLNEIQSAIGLVNLMSVEKKIKNRKKSYLLYKKLFKDIKGIKLFSFSDIAEINYSYLPIFIEKSAKINRDELEDILQRKGIGCRKYFFPIIPKFDGIKTNEYKIFGSLKNAEYLSNQVLCLPIYSSITSKQIYTICSVISNEMR